MAEYMNKNPVVFLVGRKYREAQTYSQLPSADTEILGVQEHDLTRAQAAACALVMLPDGKVVKFNGPEDATSGSKLLLIKGVKSGSGHRTALSVSEIGKRDLLHGITEVDITVEAMQARHCPAFAVSSHPVGRLNPKPQKQVSAAVSTSNAAETTETLRIFKDGRCTLINKHWFLRDSRADEDYRRINTFRMWLQWFLSALKFLFLWLGVTTLLRYPTSLEVCPGCGLNPGLTAILMRSSSMPAGLPGSACYGPDSYHHVHGA